MNQTYLNYVYSKKSKRLLFKHQIYKSFMNQIYIIFDNYLGKKELETRIKRADRRNENEHIYFLICK